MKDTELRGVVLKALYDKRRDEKRYLGYEDFDLDISKDDFLPDRRPTGGTRID
ncbi:MAG: hypothetical protein R3F11_18385 [Verrucomicrobiales bacterium]